MDDLRRQERLSSYEVHRALRVTRKESVVKKAMTFSCYEFSPAPMSFTDSGDCHCVDAGYPGNGYPFF
jgi:hypothetical protein